jgi:hypothetical protein
VLRRRVSLLDAFVREVKTGPTPAVQMTAPPVSLAKVMGVLEA